MTLSILIAAYNVELFIEKCVESCFDQNFETEYEIIVVNDGSSDNTAAIIKSLFLEIPNLKLINKENEGLGAARNTGIQEAMGEYLWMIDGDDFIERNKLSRLIKELKAKTYDILCINYNITDKEGEVIRTAYPIDKNAEIYFPTVYYQKFHANSYTWQYLIRKSIFTENNLLFKPSINMQDSEIFPKIIYHSSTIKYLDLIAYNYVQHPNSFTNNSTFVRRFRYFESIVIVNDSLENFKNSIWSKNEELGKAVGEKQNFLHQIIFNHLVFFKYSSLDLKVLIRFLYRNHFYPLQFNPQGKFKLIKYGLNNYPVFTKKVIDKIRK